MESKPPWLEILSPEGKLHQFPLTQDRISIGREGYPCDLPLGPDPKHFISRSHCYLERKHSGFWLTENGKNATVLRQGGESEVVHGQVLLADGNTFSILGLVDERGEHLHWLLTLHDPEQTRSDPSPLWASVSLKYDRAQGRLWRLRGKLSEEIQLTANELKLIDYMLERNRQAHNVAVLCLNEELLDAVYGESSSPRRHSLANPEDNFRHLIKDLRLKLEVNSKEPKFLVGHRGYGHLLRTHPPVR